MVMDPISSQLSFRQSEDSNDSWKVLTGNRRERTFKSTLVTHFVRGRSWANPRVSLAFAAGTGKWVSPMGDTGRSPSSLMRRTAGDFCHGPTFVQHTEPFWFSSCHLLNPSSYPFSSTLKPGPACLYEMSGSACAH